jgi:hypothetical protein
MGRRMNRGKQQVLFNYLPGKTFDFERIATISRVRGIRGIPRTELNAGILLRKVREDAQAWPEDFRPALRDDILADPRKFVLLDPKGVQAEMYPKVFWCQNRRCGAVYDFRARDSLSDQCPTCQGVLIQLPFVRIHRCGALLEWLPPACARCGTNRQISLDKRGSERISNFLWRCRGCGWTQSPYAGRCPQCSWPDTGQRDTELAIHRAGRTFYAHTSVLLNVPHRRWDAFLNLPEWPAIAGAKFLGLPEVQDRSLGEFSPSLSGQCSSDASGLSAAELNDLLERLMRGELTPEQAAVERDARRTELLQAEENQSAAGIARALVTRTGVPIPTWNAAGHELLEAVIPLENSRVRDVLDCSITHPAAALARRVGLSRLLTVEDFPIITATYGYSRADYRPRECRLNPFPADRDHGGRFPIFVDEVQADALVLTLNPERVCAWLDAHGLPPTLPPGTDVALSRQAYFVELLAGLPLRETLRADRPQARMVFGLMHTLSHLAVRQAALLCGLDRASLREYLLPGALTFALYCSHRDGATIGALTALFEQAVPEWLNALRGARRCVYDPVCRQRAGNCHACTHLAETSCQFFNLNLSRAFLFGGRDTELGQISVGYLDPSLA